ncbi:unnamed protein product [Mytilus coruscus]|uniref:Uncharacterized protein n=1 Tax=Mytilus coruscus TaxID=42192 RepID=A0A6J8AWH2_MYTCO|nr:unnamed protein product [Mytilus coruscus]
MFASNLQIFMGTKTIQENISSNELNVQNLFDNGSFSNLTMVCTLNEKLNGFIKEIKTFGDIKVNKCEKHASFSWRGDKSPQIFKPMSGDKSIENINARLHSNQRDHSVVCYDFSGPIQWKYSDVLLRKPYGITLDSNSNIYVAGSESNNIVVISPDGKQAKELFGASNGISSPRAIFYHKAKNVLLVANYYKDAFMYDVI